ncbi:MAG: protein jag, partial [Chloroflexota bacterium]
LSKLGVRREDVEITVLSEGKSGILGFRSEDARVRVTLLPAATAPDHGTETETVTGTGVDPVLVAKEILERLLTSIGVDATVVVDTNPGTDPTGAPLPPVLDIEGEGLGVLIGRRGETLSSLQFLVNLIVGKKCGFRSRVTVDVEGYRRRRDSALRGLALRMADQVVATRQPVALEAMPASERRIVHLALSDHPDVKTQSTGEGERRKVLIVLKR